MVCYATSTNLYNWSMGWLTLALRHNDTPQPPTACHEAGETVGLSNAGVMSQPRKPSRLEYRNPQGVTLSSEHALQTTAKNRQTIIIFSKTRERIGWLQNATAVPKMHRPALRAWCPWNTTSAIKSATPSCTDDSTAPSRCAVSSVDAMLSQ